MYWDNTVELLTWLSLCEYEIQNELSYHENFKPYKRNSFKQNEKEVSKLHPVVIKWAEFCTDERKAQALKADVSVNLTALLRIPNYAIISHTKDS